MFFCFLYFYGLAIFSKQFLTILGARENRSKVTSKTSGTTTGRTNDNGLGLKKYPQAFEKKFEKSD